MYLTHIPIFCSSCGADDDRHYTFYNGGFICRECWVNKKMIENKNYKTVNKSTFDNDRKLT